MSLLMLSDLNLFKANVFIKPPIVSLIMVNELNADFQVHQAKFHFKSICSVKWALFTLILDSMAMDATKPSLEYCFNTQCY